MKKKIILWSEFPEEVDWKKASNLLSKVKLKVEVYVASLSKKDFLKWKKKETASMKIKAWPVLPKNEGYWFSGFTKKENISLINDFSGMDMKIDLEPLMPSFDYSNPRIILYVIKFLFKKGRNNEYLEKTIIKAKGNLIINEFPLPKFVLKRWGCHIEKLEKNMTRNFMAYTSLSVLLRPLLKAYLKLYLKRELKENPKTMCSLGLIGHGILKTEPYYRSAEELKEDLEMVNFLGIKQIAVYSLESILKRENSEEWLTLLKQA